MTTRQPKKLHSIAVRLDDQTLADLRAAAVEESRTISNLVALLIRTWLAERQAAQSGLLRE